VLTQDLLEDDAAANGATDASGNPILKDIGTFMKSECKGYFKASTACEITPSLRPYARSQQWAQAAASRGQPAP
jgi:hypothetical protein